MPSSSLFFNQATEDLLGRVRVATRPLDPERFARRKVRHYRPTVSFQDEEWGESSWSMMVDFDDDQKHAWLHFLMVVAPHEKLRRGARFFLKEGFADTVEVVVL